MENTKALYEKIVKFLEDEMTTEDIKSMPLSSSTLYKYKKEPNKIKHASFLTFIRIDEYMVTKKEKENQALAAKRKEIEYVGVDLGTKKAMSISDIDMLYSQTIINDNIKVLVEKFDEDYNKRNLTKKDKNKIRNSFYKRLRHQMRSVNKDIADYWHEDIILVVGKPSIRSSEIMNIFFTMMIRLLNKELDGRFTVRTINEHYTSITCPKCNYGDGDNRTTSNKFICKKCGFKHEIDDEVAARNILDKYLKLNNITV